MRLNYVVLFALTTAITYSHQLQAQNKITYKDSVVYRVTLRDTTIYRYDTVAIKYFIHSDTVWTTALASKTQIESARKKKLLNPNNWGIGPSIGAYFSPFHGFDVNIGFGVQYYFLSIPSFKNPHMGSHNRKRK